MSGEEVALTLFAAMALFGMYVAIEYVWLDWKKSRQQDPADDEDPKAVSSSTDK